MAPHPDPTRRSFLQGVVAAGVAVPIAAATASATGVPARAAPVALSDRALGLRQPLGIFELAREYGATGVELDFGRLAAKPQINSRLLRPAGRRLFDKAANDAGVAIASLRFGELADLDLANDPRLDATMDDFLYTLHAAAIPVGVLPLRRSCELGDAGVRATVIRRLTATFHRAEQDGLTLAIDAALPPAAWVTLLDDIGSPAVRAAVRDAASFEAVGPGRVAQVRVAYHGSDAGARRAQSTGLRDTIGSARWNGWVVVDRPAVAGGLVLDDARDAVRHARTMFA